MSLFMKLAARGQRKDFQKLMEERENMPISSNVICRHNIPYMEDSVPEHTFDLYLPKEGKGLYPLVFNLHGGGLMTGSKEFNKCFCADLAAKGNAVCSIEYSKMPEKSLETLLREVLTAELYILAHAEEFRADIRKVKMTGDSGGGFLAFYSTAILRNPALCRELKFEVGEEILSGIQPENAPQVMALISPLIYTEGQDIVRRFYHTMLYHGGKKSSPAFAQPGQPEVLSALPPLLLVTSEKDNLREDSEAFSRTMEAHGRQCRLLTYSDDRLEHDFALFHPEFAESEEVVERIAEWLADQSVRNR